MPLKTVTMPPAAIVSSLERKIHVFNLSFQRMLSYWLNLFLLMLSSKSNFSNALWRTVKWLISRDLNYCKQVSWVYPSGINNRHSYRVTSCHTVLCIPFYLDHHSESLYNGALLLPFTARRFSFPSFLIPAAHRKGTVKKWAIFISFLLVLVSAFRLLLLPCQFFMCVLLAIFLERLTPSLLRHRLALSKRHWHTLEDSEGRPLISDHTVGAPPVLTFPARFCMAQAEPMLTVIVALLSSFFP